MLGFMLESIANKHTCAMSGRAKHFSKHSVKHLPSVSALMTP